MQIFLIILIIILIVGILVLLVKFLDSKKKLEYYKMVSTNISTMAVIQKMFEIMGTNIQADKKIEELNKVILDTYKPRYSTISVFDGNVYEAKATNVEEEYLDCIVNVADDNDFKANAMKNISKYLTTTTDKTLSYKSATERKIRSAMFSPIFYNNTYLGFWLMEDELDSSFDGISKDELAKIKNNLGIFLDTVQFQSTIEMAESKDKQTGLYNNLYLYSNVRNILLNYDSSTIAAIYISNMMQINEAFDRSVGNELIVSIANAIKELSTKDQILVRYSGIKFVVAVPNSDVETMQDTFERLLARLKTISIKIGENEVRPDIKIITHTFKKQNNIEKEIQKMMRAIDGMRDTNTIKII